MTHSTSRQMMWRWNSVMNKSFRYYKLQCVFFLIVLITTQVCNAQKTVTHNNQQWLQYYLQLQLPRKLTLLSDVSIRRINNLQQWSQITARFGVGYMLPKKIQIATGVACFSFFNSNKASKIEFRVYQELYTTQKIKGISIQNRFRIEERYFRTISDGEITSNSIFNFRFRYRLFFTVPLQKSSTNNSDPKFFLNIGDEVFANVDKGIKYNVLITNRLLLGASIKFQDNITVSFLYSYQYGQKNALNVFEHSDIFWIGITHKINLKRQN